MNIQRNWVTPVTAGAFLLSAVTGVLIFFHADTGANKFVHEWLSWVLLGGVALHVLANLGGLKSHLATVRGKLLVGVFVLALAASFIPLGGASGEPPFMQPIRALSSAPLTTLAEVAKVTPGKLRDRLSKAGVQTVSDEQSVSELVGPDMRQQMRVLGIVLANER
ncbi:MAG: DUF4405 domain-containing protein [Gallionellaceae bacterium]|nr:DUF4405 domain-containing protein [Gallionellaceae bacterium]